MKAAEADESARVHWFAAGKFEGMIEAFQACIQLVDYIERQDRKPRLILPGA